MAISKWIMNQNTIAVFYSAYLKQIAADLQGLRVLHHILQRTQVYHIS